MNGPRFSCASRHAKSLVLIGWIFCISTNASLALQASCTPALRANWVPSMGQSTIQADQASRYIYNYMYWHNASRLSWFVEPTSTFELDTVFYNWNDAASTGQGPAYGLTAQGGWWWGSNLPFAYLDTPIFDNTEFEGSGSNSLGQPNEPNISVGSAVASSIQPQTIYYYATRMSAGDGLRSLAKLVAQRGRRVPSNCYNEFCSFGCEVDGYIKVIPFSTFFAPSCNVWWFEYYIDYWRTCVVPRRK